MRQGERAEGQSWEWSIPVSPELLSPHDPWLSLLSMDGRLRPHHVLYRPRCLIRGSQANLCCSSPYQWIGQAVNSESCQASAMWFHCGVILRPFARRFPMYLMIGLPLFP